MTRDIQRHSTQLPSITESLETQQKQLIKYFRRQNKINKQTDDEIKKLRDTQNDHKTLIATLQAIVLAIQNTGPPTPMSQQRLRKRLKQKPKNDSSVLETSEIESEDELHQIHAITSLQNNSIEQLSFIYPKMDESTIDDDLIPWDNNTTDSEGSTADLSFIGTQDQDTTKDDLGEDNPGQGT
jgi:hypothetical protein